MKISYEQFEECIKSIVDQDEYMSRLYDLGFNLYENNDMRTGECLVNLLGYLTNDKSANWIAYWLYDCDYGRGDLCDSIKDKDGNKIPFRTIKDLWNMLVMNDKEENKND